MRSIYASEGAAQKGRTGEPGFAGTLPSRDLMSDWNIQVPLARMSINGQTRRGDFLRLGNCFVVGVV
jgi:hypothetical protein